MATATTPVKILADNVKAARARRRLEQQDLADRMRTLGWKWVRQTVGEVENNRRRLTAEEVFGLAIALETSIPALMAPADEDETVDLPSGEKLSVTAVQMLARGLSGIGIAWHHNKIAMTAPAITAERFRDSFPQREAEGEGPAIVAAIVTSQLGVLVGRRNDGKPPWTFIAGEQDAVQDESPKDTAVREVKEETGLRIVPGDVIGDRNHPKTGRHMIYVAAKPAARASLDVAVEDTEELAEVRWVDLAELDGLMGAGNIFGPVREHLVQVLGEEGG